MAKTETRMLQPCGWCMTRDHGACVKLRKFVGGWHKPTCGCTEAGPCGGDVA